jgi:hypothetical protein
MKLRELPSSPGYMRVKRITGCKACCERSAENKQQIHCDLAEFSLQMTQANLKRESPVCTENLIGVDDLTESPKLAE